MKPAPGWPDLLRAAAPGYAEVALANVGREFPVLVRHLMTGPDDLPRRPRDVTPVFYGSLDWHSCVEMHWVLARLLRVLPDEIPVPEIRAALDAQFTSAGLAAEAEFVTSPAGAWERPYGWGWALALAHEIAACGDPHAARWAAAMRPLAQAATARLAGWLDTATYPVRHGLHPNSAFGMSRALPYARQQAAAGDGGLADAITARALHWFGADTDYPGRYEPSGHDFLSPALAEAELMAQVLAAADFGDWIDAFLPGIAAGQPAALFVPAVVSDASDGQIAHLHGLNASRAWCWRRLAQALPAGDPRAAAALAAAHRHARAALPHVAGDDYMVGHWLVAYAVLLLS